ncbi:hypothetical protein JCM33374_g1399 [Metschnikowia sp. JCM 33374]|nr:hypothetical protein JCM33374_g1399 [Metschnikowia sp. JCM 33374]
MNFLIHLAFFSLVWAEKCLQFGTMHITKNDGPRSERNQPKYLVVVNRYIFASYWQSFFSYDEDGYLEKFKTGTYVGVNGHGQMFMANSPQSGFSLTPVGGSKSSVLSFDGNKVFHLCADDSIDLTNRCEGAVPVTIVFNPISGPCTGADEPRVKEEIL